MQATNQPNPLAGQIALVTGASRGIGEAILRMLGKAGATVIGTATTDAGAAAINKNILDAGFVGAGLMLNVQSPEQIGAAIKNIEEKFGAVSILVNNAGITRDTLLMRMADEEMPRTARCLFGARDMAITTTKNSRRKGLVRWQPEQMQ